MRVAIADICAYWLSFVGPWDDARVSSIRRIHRVHQGPHSLTQVTFMMALSLASEPSWRQYGLPQTCDASNFTLDLGDTHCPELSPSSTAAATADECMKACCATDGCETYQYCAEGESCGHGYWFEAGALSAGGDLDGWPQNTTLDKATAACTANATCHGMTYHEADPSPSGVLKIWLKTAASGRTTDTTWSRLLRAAPGCYLGQLHRACANATGDGWQSKAKPPPPVWLGFVSAIFGDHMVLQRAPQQAVIWGHTTPGATVTVELDQSWSAQAPAADDGVWRVTLPATAASLTPHSLSISASTGESAQLCDVLFGEVVAPQTAVERALLPPPLAHNVAHNPGRITSRRCTSAAGSRTWVRRVLRECACPLGISGALARAPHTCRLTCHASSSAIPARIASRQSSRSAS